MGFLFSLHQYGNWGLLALRLVVGIIFLVHGSMKRGMWKTQPSSTMPQSMLAKMRILSIAEPLGAIAMILGLLTQLAALGFIIIMLGAIAAKRGWGKTFTGDGGWEFDFSLLGSAVALFFIGGGAISLDHFWWGW